jgi:glycosyltransferase involved in cell wall biosynthesis
MPAAPPTAGETGEDAPRISVVMPSFNQGRYLEAAIRSVLLQGYPDVELIVMDGGSTDESVLVIRQYEAWLASWQSQPDGGQAAAIRAGLERATGTICCWLNSDDLLLPGALWTVAGLFERRPRVDVVYGNRLVIDREGGMTGYHVFPQNLTRAHWALGQPLAQEACFWRKEAYDGVGGIDPSLFFIMDYDLLFRIWRKGRFLKTPEFLGGFRVHEEAKNTKHRDVLHREFAAAQDRFGLRPIHSRLLNWFDRVQRLLEARTARGSGAYERAFGLMRGFTATEGRL